MDRVLLAGLIKIELRSGPVIRWCDGGAAAWDGETFSAGDPVFGSIGAIEALTEGAAEEVPAMKLTIFPAAAATAGQLAVPGNQGSRVRMWIAEVDEASGEATRADLLFDGQLDTIDLILGERDRRLEIEVVSTAERLFAANEGNSLSARFHKATWPGETGEDNATGLGIQVPWGTVKPVTGGVYSPGGGGFGQGIYQNAVQYV